MQAPQVTTSAVTASPKSPRDDPSQQHGTPQRSVTVKSGQHQRDVGVETAAVAVADAGGGAASNPACAPFKPPPAPPLNVARSHGGLSLKIHHSAEGEAQRSRARHADAHDTKCTAPSTARASGVAAGASTQDVGSNTTSDSKRSLLELEAGVPLSQSVLFALQRAFYAQHSIDAWSKSLVPNYITTNAFIADQFVAWRMRVAVLGYVVSLDLTCWCALQVRRSRRCILERLDFKPWRSLRQRSTSTEDIGSVTARLCV